jgi:hypothetical protein
MSDNEVDVAGLRAAAEGATPGPWRSVYVNGTSRADVRSAGGRDYRGSAVATAADSAFGACPAADAEFIAGAGPDVVLDLLDHLEAAEGAVERLEQQIHEPGGFIDMSVPSYADALYWAADVARSEARWQYEQDRRGTVGAQVVAQRAQVLESCYREAAERHVATLKASESTDDPRGPQNGSSDREEGA